MLLMALSLRSQSQSSKRERENGLRAGGSLLGVLLERRHLFLFHLVGQWEGEHEAKQGAADDDG